MPKPDPGASRLAVDGGSDFGIFLPSKGKELSWSLLY
jgi:hypothetical protein